MDNNTKEDNSPRSVMYQGKTLAQWEKEFDGEFTSRQLFQLIRSGVDLGRVKLGLVDEAKDIDDKSLFKGEEFFFKEDECNESARHPEDVVTVDDLIAVLRNNANPNDKVMFRVDKKECILFDVHSKGGTTVVDIVKGRPMYEAYDKTHEEKWEEMATWFNGHGYEIEDNEDRLEQIAPQGDSILFKKGMCPDGKDVDKSMSFNDAWETYQELKAKEDKQMNEGRGWYGGGYGGTGRSYSSFKGQAPRGEAIGWYSVAELDPKARGKMLGWRCGPANFPFVDALYPNRKYKKGAMMMRNKYVQAGANSGVVEIGVASYFDAIKNNDEKALETLRLLKIPLDLTFGMDPNDDYSNNYSITSK